MIHIALKSKHAGKLTESIHDFPAAVCVLIKPQMKLNLMFC